MGKATVIFIGMWVVSLLGLGWHARQLEEFKILHIQAATDVPALGHPVYAQFIYTQTLTLPRPVPLKHLEIPMYITEPAPVVRLLQAGRVLHEWDATTSSYILDEPLLISQVIEVQIDGGHIPPEDEARAPRVFVETADYAYPNGQYRIADNIKEGDIGMTLFGRRTVLERLKADWQDKPGDMLTRTLAYTVLAATVSALPFVVRRPSVTPRLKQHSI